MLRRIAAMCLFWIMQLCTARPLKGLHVMYRNLSRPFAASVWCVWVWCEPGVSLWLLIMVANENIWWLLTAPSCSWCVMMVMMLMMVPGWLLTGHIIAGHQSSRYPVQLTLVSSQSMNDISTMRNVNWSSDLFMLQSQYLLTSLMET